MKITIESTPRHVDINGVPARIWEGTTDKGVPMICFITRIAVREDHDCLEFVRELTECRQPSADVQAWPARMVL